jgi:hypothetical protein
MKSGGGAARKKSNRRPRRLSVSHALFLNSAPNQMPRQKGETKTAFGMSFVAPHRNLKTGCASVTGFRMA